jgi:hypothetical protein
MTGHTSDEHLDGMQEERSTTSETAPRTPNTLRGVVQDSPGNHDVGVADDAGGNGNLSAETLVSDHEANDPA